jgi:hypothetical protein
VGFWSSLFVEIIGGLFTALVLGAGAAAFAASQRVGIHDDRIDELYEDNRRWFRDRDRRLGVEKAVAQQGSVTLGGLYGGAWIQETANTQQDALHDYRDEISAKRRRYRELRAAEGKGSDLFRTWRSRPMRRFELTDPERKILASWRANVEPEQSPGTSYPIEDPTSAELEPELRHFEVEGDPAPASPTERRP